MAKKPVAPPENPKFEVTLMLPLALIESVLLVVAATLMPPVMFRVLPVSAPMAPSLAKLISPE